MKVLTVAVPCYNSSAYMRKCLNSLVAGGNEVEVLIIDDGSTRDNSLEIAREYEKKYPSICRAIHQENKGHGGAVNTGIKNASGYFFKVCDSDDWFDGMAFPQFLAVLRNLVKEEEPVDCVFSNFIYDKVDKKRKFTMQYRRYFPLNTVFGWDDIRPMDEAHYVLMHSITYRTEVLRDFGLSLPEHTFYVDNIYAYEPFVKVKKMFYCPVTLYHYFIGRADQSVNEDVMYSRLDQQIRVTNRMIDFAGTLKDRELEKNQRKFIIHYLGAIMMITLTMLIRHPSEENERRRKALWTRLKNTDYACYFRRRYSVSGTLMNIPGKPGEKLVNMGYHATQKVYGFE